MATKATNYGMVFPHRWQKVGFGMLIIGYSVVFIVSLLGKFGIPGLTPSDDWQQTYFYPIWPIILHISLFLICLSSERDEDEFVMQIRMGIIKKILCWWFCVTLLCDSIQWVLEHLGLFGATSMPDVVCGVVAGLSNVYLLAAVYIVWLKNKLSKLREEAARG